MIKPIPGHEIASRRVIITVLDGAGVGSLPDAAKLKKDDSLFITADHGCDPPYPTTDHTREYVPLLAWSPFLINDMPVGTRNSLSDVAASTADWLGIEYTGTGIAFLDNR